MTGDPAWPGGGKGKGIFGGGPPAIFGGGKGIFRGIGPPGPGGPPGGMFGGGKGIGGIFGPGPPRPMKGGGGMPGMPGIPREVNIVRVGLRSAKCPWRRKAVRRKARAPRWREATHGALCHWICLPLGVVGIRDAVDD